MHTFAHKQAGLRPSSECMRGSPPPSDHPPPPVVEVLGRGCPDSLIPPPLSSGLGVRADPLPSF